MTHNFLLKASLLYKDICPEQSRFLLQRHQSTAAALPQSIICPFCFEWRKLGNHHVRLRPKRKPTARIRRLLKRESAGKRLSAEQTAVLQKFKRASNAMMATCHTCNKVSRQPGMNRELLVSLSKHKSTPGSASKHRTPQTVNWATPKSVANRTPSSTPRSASSNTSSSSSSKSSSVKSSPFARLKKILMLENKQQGKKGGLKDFLSSLWRPQSCRWKKKTLVYFEGSCWNSEVDHFTSWVTMPSSGGVIRDWIIWNRTSPFLSLVYGSLWTFTLPVRGVG